MKLLPKSKKTKKEYPTLKEYRESREKGKTNLIMATTFSMTLSLTPFFLTSCNSEKVTSEKIKNMKIKIEKTKVEKTKVEKTKIEKIKDQIGKPNQVLGRQALSDDKNFKDSRKTIKTSDSKDKKIEKPQALDGVVGSFKDNPCDTDIKNTKKDEKSEKVKESKVINKKDEIKEEDKINKKDKIKKPKILIGKRKIKRDK